MSEERQQHRAGEPKRDSRAGEPPASDEADPQSGSTDTPEDASEETSGPYGNPQVDEESLRHRQQEPGRPAGE